MNNTQFNSKLRLWSIAVLFAALAAGCGGGGGSGGVAGSSTIAGAPAGAIVPGTACTASVGATIPRVLSSSPSSGNLTTPTSTTGVANNGKLITATFSLAMNPATINSAVAGALATFTIKETVAGTNVPGTVLLDTSGLTATFTTSAALRSVTQYTAIITVAATGAGGTGQPLGCVVAWNFTTGLVSASLAPVNFGLAGTFGMAANAGLTNTPGTTTINGDVVLVSTLTCNLVAVPGGPGTAGFGACGTGAPVLSGTVVTPSVPNGSTTAAAVVADLTAAFFSTCFPGRPSASCSLSGVTVVGAIGGVAGAALVDNVSRFTPGVYVSASTIDVTGDVTLDALGDPDAVFIFQAGSALNVAAGAAPPMVVSPPSGIHTRILLVNGAKASNVYWSVGSTATLDLFSEMQGNILASASIVMKTGATSCGRLLAGAFTAGQFTFDNNLVSVPGRSFSPPATYSSVCQ